MTEIDYLKCKLEDTEKAFDKLHKRHIELLKQQGKLEKENEQLKERLYDFEKRKIIEESEIDEDVIPKVKLLRAELFGEKYE